MIKVADYISLERTFLFEEEKDKGAIIRKLCESIARSENITHPQKFTDDILEREKIMSTGIGLGIAIPHTKSEHVKDITIALGVSRKGIEWDALDGKPVHFVVMIAAHISQHNDYLKILAKVALVLKSEKKRDLLIHAGSPDAIYEVFSTL
ncbi:MAG TPA: PTS sugar transporter subunit IIA [Candidatus Mcinerneyibacteriales bacterium]|nr:PTS sugar transporter subunit IIA [Candidatus Mcinerneyibacteriales bacterium]